MPQTGAGVMAQLLGTLAPLAEDIYSAPNLMSGGSQFPAIPDPGDQIHSSDVCIHCIMSTNPYTEMHIFI